MKIGPTTWWRSALAVLACTCAPMHATAQQPNNLSELVQYDIVFMDGIATPLLHHVMTGTPYRGDVIAHDAGDTSYDVKGLGTLRMKATSQNEFVREEVRPEWQAYLDTQVNRLRHARAYLIPLSVEWKQYDFARARYTISVHMNRQASMRGGPSYHCSGSFAVAPNGDHMTSCLHAVNEDQKDSFLSEFPVEDRRLARDLRESGGQFYLMALAKPAGKYKVLRGNELRYLPSDFFAAAGYQAVNITHLLLIDRNSGAIYIVASRPGSGPAPWDGIASAAPVLTSDASPSAAMIARSATGGPGWRVITKSSGATLYVDPNSLRREQSLVMLRTLMDFSSSADTGVYSTVAWYESDCAKRTLRQVQGKSYAEHMGAGAVLVDAPDAQPTLVPAQGSVAESLFNYACNARTPQT